jgi:hypothetical protein
MFPAIADLNVFWSIISMCFFIGGLTIGWVSKDWKKSMKRRGDGRWD